MKSLSTLTASSSVTSTLFGYNCPAGTYQQVAIDPAAVNTFGLAFGYWVFSNGPGTIAYTGTPNDGALATTNLCVGWNLLGAPGPNPMPVSGMRSDGNALTGAVCNPPASGACKSFRTAFQFVGGTYVGIDLTNGASVFTPTRGQWVHAFSAKAFSFFVGAVPDAVGPPPPPGN